MSQRSERIEEVLEELEVPLERAREWYHVPVLAALLAFMLWVRARNWQAFVDGDRVLFSGNDAWYHLRMVEYTVSNWPATMPFDPWTRFPLGTSVGQFGTLFDQIIATAALVVGLGSPTAKQVAMTHLFAPAVFGTLAAVPAYFLGKRLGGRFGGLVGVLVLALTPGQFLARSLAGFSDHHIAEVLFMATAVLAVAVAVTVAEEERPVYELFVTREWDALRRPVGWAALAGVALGLYIWVWPPGVFLVGILGMFFAVTLAYHHVRGISPDHVAVAGVTMNVVAGVLALLPLNVLEFSATGFSLAQPLVAFAVAGGCAFMAALSRTWDERDLPQAYYPVGVAAIGLAVVVAFRLALPETFGFFQDQFLRVFGFGATATAQTVAEAQPPPQGAINFLRGSYSLAFFTALLGFALLLVRVARDDEPRAEHLLVLVWSVFMTAAALTQLRFDYYLAVAVAVLNAYLVGRVVYLVALDEVADPLDVELYQVMAVVAVLLVVAVPLALTGSGQVGAVAASNPQPGEVTAWTDSLDWVRDNTPEEGAYGDGTPSDLEYYGTYPRQDDFQYDEGEYGVIAWWDYGHWITVMGERIPFANPFQQGAHEAADYLLATNETNANGMLVSEDGERTRYVMVDYQLGIPGTQKFSAPTAWEETHDVGRSDLSIPVFNPQTGSPAFSVRRQRSYESMRTRLYVFHGSAASPEFRGGRTIVVDYDVGTFEMTSGERRSLAVLPENGQPIRRFNSTAEARAFMEENDSRWPDDDTTPEGLGGEPTSQIGGVGGIPTERVSALQHYRLVHAGEPVTQSPFGSRYPWVKTFERVPGATVEGTGPPDATVTAVVRMNMTNVNRTFRYRQRAETGPDGEFTMTLPYSTDGYENWGTAEGYTDVSVRALGPYRLTTGLVENETGARIRYSATANVSEARVIGEDESTIRVDLQPGLTIPSTRTGGNTTGGNTTDGNTTDGNTSDGNTTSVSDNTSDTNTSSGLHSSGASNYAGPRAPRS